MIDILKGAGILIWPLALCSFVAVYIVCERLYALRNAASPAPSPPNTVPLWTDDYTSMFRVLK